MYIHKINCIHRKQQKCSGLIPATLIQPLCYRNVHKINCIHKKQLSGRIPDTLGKTVHKSDAAQADEIHSYTHSLQICTMPRLQSVFNRCSSWVVSSTDCIKYTSYQRYRDGWVQRSRLHKLLSIDIIRGRYFVLKSAGGTFAKAISCMTVIMAFNRLMSSGR